MQTRLEMIEAMRLDRDRLIEEVYWAGVKKIHATEANCQPMIDKCDKEIGDILIKLDSIKDGLKAIGG